MESIGNDVKMVGDLNYIGKKMIEDNKECEEDI